MENLAEILKCDEQCISQIKEKLQISNAEQLYAKYIAIQKNDRLFALALGIGESDVKQMMENLREALPPERLAKLEKPVPIEHMGLGARIDSPEEDESRRKSRHLGAAKIIQRLFEFLKLDKKERNRSETEQ